MATAAPSYAECWAQLVDLIELYDDLHTNVTTGATAWATQQDVIEQAYEGQYITKSKSIIDGHRAQLSGVITGFGSTAQPYILELGRAISSPQTSIQAILVDLYRYMIDNSSTVNGRNFTRGNPTKTSGTGTGDIYRITVDSDNMPIEGGDGGGFGGAIPTTWRFKCVQDQNSGAQEGNAVYNMWSEGTLPTDALFPVTALPTTYQITEKSGDDSISGFRNPHFSTYNSGGTVTTKFTGWTLSVLANATQNTSTVFRADRSGTSSALEFTDDCTISQKIEQRISIDPSKPYQLLVHWNRNGAAGDLTIYIGSKSATVAVSAQSGWQVLEMSESDPDGCWPVNFTEDDLDIAIVWDSTAGSNGPIIDDIYFGPMDGPYAGAGYLHNATGATESLLDDKWYMTDTEVGGIVQEWLDRGFGWYAPSLNNGSETISDPS